MGPNEDRVKSGDQVPPIFEPTNELPRVQFMGKNVSDTASFEPLGYDVAEWTPGKNGEGTPQAVAMIFHMQMKDMKFDTVVRLWSAREVNRLINQLVMFRKSVFGDNDRVVDRKKDRPA